MTEDFVNLMINIIIFIFTTVGGMLLCFVGLAVIEGTGSQNSLGALPLLIFGLMTACDACGGGCGVYVIPGEVFPTSARATAHGIASAAGKIGGKI
tara:strand:- start:271 stop:558 length:288 start_codon:yes stop_codon:yes gene_type:complete